MKKVLLLVLVIFFVANIFACTKTDKADSAYNESLEATEKTESLETEMPLPTEPSEQTDQQSPVTEFSDPDMEVEIPDPALRTAVLSTLATIGKPPAGAITVADMMALKELAIISHAWEPQQDELRYITPRLSSADLLQSADGIESLEGLQYAKNLEKLIILGNPPHIEGGTDNTFQDLSPISGLENLEVLSLRFNNLHDISPISTLKKLTELELQYNPELEDISAIGELKNLSVLDLQHCYMADFNAIKNFENIEQLYLCGDFILIILADLKNLQHLECREGDAVGIWELHELQDMRTLDLSFQHINDIRALASMSNLENLNLFSNEIDDISALKELQNLKILAIDEKTYNNNEDTVNALKANGCQIYTEDIFPAIIRALR